MYRLIRFGTFILPLMPHWLQLALANTIGWLMWLTVGSARKAATANIRHVLGTDTVQTQAGQRQLRRIVQSLFRYAALRYIDLCAMPSLSAQYVQNNLIIKGVEHIDEALTRGKGIVFFAAHFGPFETLAQWFPFNGYKVIIPVERLEDTRMLDLVVKLRSSHGVQFLPLGSTRTMRTILQALRNNELVLILADRAVEGQSVEVPFFGAKAQFPIGPISLAQRTGAALMGAFGWSVSSTQIHGEFVPLSLTMTEEERNNTDVVMSRFVKIMEQFISEHPEQWMVFNPIWNEDETSTHPA